MRTIDKADEAQLLATIDRWIEREVAPRVKEFDHADKWPAEIVEQMKELGLFGATVSADYGGLGLPARTYAEIVMRVSSVWMAITGIFNSHLMLALAIEKFGTEPQKRHWLPRLASGEIRGGLALTEPDAGTDLQAIRLTARREGDHYVLNGQKTFITNGINSELVIVVAKTAPEMGAKGVSLIVVEDGMPGFSKGRKLEKIGLMAQDTSELFFDNVRVPADHLLGEENAGFRYLMHELAQERLVVAVRAAASIEAFLHRTIAYTRERKAFGQPVFDFQNTRFKLAEAKAQATMLRVFVDDCIALHLRRALAPDRAAMVKLNATALQNRLLDEFLQLHGGYGYMTEYQIGRAWTDARIGRIYGGSDEIMKEIIGRTL